MFAAQDGATPNDKLYVDDVFSAYTYTGDDASTRVITNGIDLAGNGGMVWIKGRDVRNHAVFDTARGTYARLTSNSTDAQVNPYNFSLKAFNSNGFSIGSAADVNTVPSINYVSWTFRKAAKFFDVVTFNGNGNYGATVSHSLGGSPGMVVVKSLTNGQWFVYHRSLTSTRYFLTLTSANAQTDMGLTWITISDTQVVFADGTLPGQASGAHVAYLFAHDTATDGLVQCGSFTTDGSGNATVNHGWSAGVQFALIKCSSTTGDWEMFDTARTSGWSGSDARLRANLSNAEDSVTRLSASGTSVSFAGLSNSSSYIYAFVVAPT